MGEFGRQLTGRRTVGAVNGVVDEVGEESENENGTGRRTKLNVDSGVVCVKGG